jgi:hypothetical protein
MFWVSEFSSSFKGVGIFSAPTGAESPRQGALDQLAGHKCALLFREGGFDFFFCPLVRCLRISIADWL